ncbi:hypothetical protein ACE3MQ_00255 [Paenibacillus lentus]|uniref:hypothetical protein n=1 Tax=Paenibacillus lentus TaxID=1338368 RepID=UPI003652A081
MIEMRSKEDLKYSNQIPKWAKFAHVVIISIIGLIGAGAFVLGGYFVYTGDWLGAILCLIVGIVIVWATRMMIIGSKLHTDFVFVSELRDDGYYTYFKNIKNGHEEEHLIPFQRMQEVLIARKTQYMSSGNKDIPGHYIVGSQIIMQWRDEHGNIDYSLFGIASRSDLSKWVNKFREHNVPLLHTYQNVSEASAADFISGYHELDKSPLSSIDLLSDIETRRRNNIPMWQSAEMKLRRAQQQSGNDRRIFRPMYGIALFALFLNAMLWMPYWVIEEEMFADSSPSAVISVLTVLSVIISRTYWRRKRRWYLPIADILMILAVSFAGLTVARLWRPIPSIYYEAALVDVLASGFFLIIVFVGFKLLHRRDRLE